MGYISVGGILDALVLLHHTSQQDNTVHRYTIPLLTQIAIPHEFFGLYETQTNVANHTLSFC